MNREFFIGDKVEVIGDSASHGQPFGTVLTIRIVNKSANQINFHEIANFTRMEDIQHIKEEKKRLLKSLTEKETEVKLIKDKIHFMEETGKDKLDAREFKEYQVQKVIEDTTIASKDKADYIYNLFGRNEHSG